MLGFIISAFVILFIFIHLLSHKRICEIIECNDLQTEIEYDSAAENGGKGLLVDKNGKFEVSRSTESCRKIAERARNTTQGQVSFLAFAIEFCIAGLIFLFVAVVDKMFS